MSDDIYGEGTTLLGDFARGFRMLERKRLAELKKSQPYIREPVYADRIQEDRPEVPLTC